MELISLWILVGLVGIVRSNAIREPFIDRSDVKVRYDNYGVYKLHIDNETQRTVVQVLANNTKYNIWKDYDEFTKEVHVMVGPDEMQNFVKLLKSYGLDMEVVVANVQALIDNEQIMPFADNEAFGWKRYYNLQEIEDWLDGILEKYPKVTKGFTIGKSYEGRPIRGIEISYNENNPVIFIESNIHAREWITSATATWFINELLTSEKPEVRNLAENYNWYIIPVFNVDGFVYSHEKNRMWRKNRQPNPNSKCIGTDINRNFDSYWMESDGASSDPCSESFAGQAPFSEPEAKALAEYIGSIKDKIKLYITFHSYSQLLLSPYGHSKTEFPPNYEQLQDISKEFANAIGGLSYKTEYNYGSSASVLYYVTGSSQDWVYNTQGIKVSYTIEFRDTGRFGFVLPSVQILPNCEELMAGMLALVARSKDLGYV